MCPEVRDAVKKRSDAHSLVETAWHLSVWSLWQFLAESRHASANDSLTANAANQRDPSTMTVPVRELVDNMQKTSVIPI